MTRVLDNLQSMNLPEINVVQRQAIIYNKSRKSMLWVCTVNKLCCESIHKV